MVFNMKRVLIICLLRLFNNYFCVIFVLCIVFNYNIRNTKPFVHTVVLTQYCFGHTVVYTQRRWKHGGFRSKTVLETRRFPLRRFCLRAKLHAALFILVFIHVVFCALKNTEWCTCTSPVFFYLFYWF